jgi:hypothetical protein
MKKHISQHYIDLKRKIETLINPGHIRHRLTYYLYTEAELEFILKSLVKRTKLSAPKRKYPQPVQPELFNGEST